MTVSDRVRKIQVPLELPRVETGAVQFGNDWPGLFIRGDDAHHLMFSIKRLAVLSMNSNPDITHLAGQLMSYTELIDQDVIIR